MSEHFSWPEGTDNGDATAGSLFVSGDNGILPGTDQLWQRQSMKNQQKAQLCVRVTFLKMVYTYFTPKSDKKDRNKGLNKANKYLNKGITKGVNK